MLIRKTKLIMFFLLKHTLIIYHTTCLNAILVNKAFKKNSLTTSKAEAACSAPTSIRRFRQEGRFLGSCLR
jgi:hypothetical protein